VFFSGSEDIFFSSLSVQGLWTTQPAI